MIRTLWAAAAVLVIAGAARAATPTVKCEIDKNKEAGKYVECRQKAEAQLARTGNIPTYYSSRQKCADKYAIKWSAIERRSAGACPSTGDQNAIKQYLDTASADVATELAGGTLAGQGHRLQTGQNWCVDYSGQYVSCPGTGQDGDFQKGLDRMFVDNGDGTISDLRTGLMWEKLSDDGTIHDKDKDFFWPNHLAKATQLNQQGFAGYTDWRIPNVNELQTLVNYGANNLATWSAFNTGCYPGCTVLTCSCTGNVFYRYWTSSSSEIYPYRPWSVEFSRGEVSVTGVLNQAARGVRGGS
ncbi:MAG TPA: DUF1566 domain-containing protein [Candidatus Binatia bacterium]|nr:DUF1566 domain-containing protein [Candidatus Binatia bacterium]